MLNRLRLNKLILLIIINLILGGCVTVYNPATERKETLLIDTKSEVELGRNMDRQIQRELKIVEERKAQDRLDSIGKRLASFSDRQDLVYIFKIIEDKEFNAFAVPGGYIYVNNGLMNAATDDELAGVVAHEIGHIAARHGVKKLQAVLGYQIVMSIALGLSGNQTMGQATDIIFNLASLGYGRQDETLSDKLAVRYTKRAGYNPYGIVTFFEKLKKEAEKKGANFNLVFLSSHPPIEERIKNVKKEIALSP